ncbi:SusC/RagA family TonB-linked outer membrane protein [Chitinophaga sp. Hz27]|uniref:SusC/RagA family TonB-linked outer membrane protein n=1 Tax=Chitinophaga sp. Hz27 TaxID=3347169 RepID=UPI0035DE41B9
MKKMTGLPSFRKVMQGCAMPLLLLFLLLVLTGRMQAQEISVLDTRVSFKAVKQPLSTVLKDIRTITNVRFTYNMDQVRKAPLVTVNQQNVTLRELLQRVLANSGLSFTEYFRGVMIMPEKAKVVQTGVLGFPIRGQVQTTDGSSLAGATVQIVGTGEGSVTMQDGLFSMIMHDHQQLRISMLGMKTVVRIITAADRDVDLLVIRLDTATREIGEVVVNGYQKIDARMSTAAVFKLSAAEVLQPGEPSIDRMLQGKVPGLMVMNNSGGVNGRPTIRMRGTTTLVGNASPLWVIDDVVRPDPVDISATQLNNVVSDAQTGNFSMIGNAISGLNPYDIESITFLKDAAATAIYGVRAANGVIVVTTKRGKAGPVQLSYNTSLSFRQRPSYNNLNLMDSKERVQLSRYLYDAGVLLANTTGLQAGLSYEGLLKALFSRQITEADFKKGVTKLETNNTDWFKVLFDNAFSMNHSLSISGGSGKTSYYGSLYFSSNRGSANLDRNKGFGGSLTIHSEASKRLALEFNVSGNYAQQQGYFPGVNPLGYALSTSRALDPTTVYPVVVSDIPIEPLPPPITFNMRNELAQTENNSSIRSLTIRAGLTYKIAKGLSFEHVSSAITNTIESMAAAYEGSQYISTMRGWDLDFQPNDAQVNRSKIAYGGIANLGNQNTLALNMRNKLDYNASLFNNRDQFIVAIGNEINSSQLKGQSSVEPGYFPDRGMNFYPTLQSILQLSSYSLTKTVNNTLSMFAFATYSFNKKYIVSATLRTDGNNRFGQYSNAKFLPNFGLSGRWSVGNERWLQTSRIISGLDFRATYGSQGNVVSSVGPELIASYPSSGQINLVTGVPLLGIKSLPYPNLRWEKTYQWNFGIDLSLFDRRINLTTDYYRKLTKDVIITRALPAEYGIGSMLKNGGRLTNQGVELTLDIAVIRQKNVGLSVRFVNSKNFNEIGPNDFQPYYSDFLNGTAYIPGRAVSGFYSFKYAGLSATNGLPTFSKLSDKTLTDDPTSYLVYSGQLQPVINGSFSPSFRYRNVSVTAELFYALGSHKRLNPLSTRGRSQAGVPDPFVNVSKDWINRWKKPGDEKYTDIPAIVDYTTSTLIGTFPVDVYSIYNQSDFRVVNNSFVRCRNLSINYTCPPQLIKGSGIKGLTAGLFVSNLFTITNKALRGQDPEIDGVGTSALPMSRQYGFTMGVNF